MYREAPSHVGARPVLTEVRVLDERAIGADQVAARPTPPAADAYGAPAPRKEFHDRVTTSQWAAPPVESLPALALTDPNPSRRIAALNLLSRGDHAEKAPATLLFALGDAAPAVRLRALQLLGERGAPPPVANLVGLLEDDSAAVRRQAVALLGATSDRAARVALWQAVNDRDQTVRELARSLAESSLVERSEKENPTVGTRASGPKAPLGDTAVQAP